jgi:hypothetical protein
MFVCCVSCVLCRAQPLRRADHSCRGVVLGVYVFLIVCDLETVTIRRRAAPPRGKKCYTCPPFIGTFCQMTIEHWFFSV